MSTIYIILIEKLRIIRKINILDATYFFQTRIVGIHKFTQPFSTDHQYIQQQKSIGNPNYLINPNPPQIFQCNMSPNIITNVIFPGETSQICEEFGLKLVHTMEKQLFNLNLYPNTSQDNPANIFQLEYSLFDLRCNLNVVKGIFYMLPIHYQGKLFVR